MLKDAKNTMHLVQKKIYSFLIIILTRLLMYYRHVNIFLNEILRQINVAQAHIQSAIFNRLSTNLVVEQKMLNKKISNIIIE